MTWRNRIVRSGELPAAELAGLAHPQNWRRHPDAQGKALTGGLAQVGWVQEVIVNETTNRILDGHLRVELALKAGATTPVPVKWVALSEDEERAILATFDPIGAMAVTEEATLLGLVKSVEDADLRGMVLEIAEGANLPGLAAVKPEQPDPGPQVDKAEELRAKWGTEPGQLWALGDHRLICGDCTDKATVERVMGGERAALAPVDPPYNVGFDYDKTTVDDNKAAEVYENFSRAWFGLCSSVSERQIVTPGGINHLQWARWFDSKHCAVWTKTNALTHGRISNSWCWEPVFFFGDGFRKQRANDIFDYPIGQQKDVANHPCPKPLAMWLDLIENYSNSGEVVYEGFSGSGTTIIACEKLGRKCRAVEISPAYCAVAIERWATMTGQTPVLLEQAP